MDQNHNYQKLTGNNLTEAVLRAIEFEQRMAFVESVWAEHDDNRPDLVLATLRMTGQVNEWLVADTALFDLTAEAVISSYSDQRCRSPRVSKSFTHGPVGTSSERASWLLALCVKPLLTRGPPQDPYAITRAC